MIRRAERRATARGRNPAAHPLLSTYPRRYRGRAARFLTSVPGNKLYKILEHLDLGIGDAIGFVAAIIFYGRFYLQWYTTERQGRSVVPVGFWYMSSAGSLLLFGYGVYVQSPVGTLSHCFNIFIYVRNLIHVWRVGGTLTRRRSVIVHGLALAVIAVAVCLLAVTWLNVFDNARPGENAGAARTWFWIAVGVVGQALFAGRFIVQWLTTEHRRESVIPVAFWYLSVAASILQFASFVQLQDWIFALGIATTLPIYLRNLWIIHRRKQAYTESA